MLAISLTIGCLIDKLPARFLVENQLIAFHYYLTRQQQNLVVVMSLEVAVCLGSNPHARPIHKEILGDVLWSKHPAPLLVAIEQHWQSFCSYFAIPTELAKLLN